MMLPRALARIVAHDAFGGILLMMAAVAALVIANSSLQPLYDGMLNAYLAITIDDEGLRKPLIL